MLNYMRHHGEQGQAVVLLAVTMIGLLAIVGLALDGGMLYWNQRRAQNGADAAAIAGTSALVTQVLADNYVCGVTSEQPILNLVNQYAASNEIPNAGSGTNVAAYYLTADSSGNRYDLVNPFTSKPWRVGDTGTIPCQKIVGLHVQASFPQDTFLAGVIGIVKTNVTVNAYAIYEHRQWCVDFAVFGISTETDKDVVAITGSAATITNGGIHSNGGIHLGGGGQGIYLEPGRAVEFDTNGSSQWSNQNITGGPDPNAANHGITQVDNYPLPDDYFYRFEDFAPGGFIWNELSSMPRLYKTTADITDSDVKNANGTLKDGLYVTTKSIKLNNLGNLGPTDHPWRATLVAMGDIKISGGINQLPLARGVFAYSLSTNTSNGAIQLSGDENRWAGMVVAPNGNVDFSGAHNSDLSGMVIAKKVSFSGSNNRINHRPEYCPVNPPRVLLVQ